MARLAKAFGMAYQGLAPGASSLLVVCRPWSSAARPAEGDVGIVKEM